MITEIFHKKRKNFPYGVAKQTLRIYIKMQTIIQHKDKLKKMASSEEKISPRKDGVLKGRRLELFHHDSLKEWGGETNQTDSFAVLHPLKRKHRKRLTNSSMPCRIDLSRRPPLFDT